MSLLVSLWRAALAFLAGPVPTPSDEARRALRAVTLEQLRDSDWPCHPHF